MIPRSSKYTKRMELEATMGPVDNELPAPILVVCLYLPSISPCPFTGIKDIARRCVWRAMGNRMRQAPSYDSLHNREKSHLIRIPFSVARCTLTLNSARSWFSRGCSRAHVYSWGAHEHKCHKEVINPRWIAAAIFGPLQKDVSVLQRRPSCEHQQHVRGYLEGRHSN